MTTFTDKELIKEIKERISSMDVRDNVERRAYEIALASLEEDPVAWLHSDNGLVGFDEGWNACRAAMLYGAVPASQAYKLPQTQFKQVADLYEMQFDDGRTCTFHTDAQKAVQWLQACDGNRVQEYVKLERLQNALSGNSPVTPDGWVMVPKRLTAENGAKGALSGEFSETTFISCLECFGDDDCDTCDGSGRIEIKVPVTWSTIKSIWDKGIEYFAAKPSQEVK
ncbi:hypothetical protein GQM97_10550 [Escherichia coli]|nr:hypothetical protein GP652_10275 [Escherichia coli]MWN28045.1 hypothetical protein [Escherichia coli]MWN44244.1 hypothetical protein [Escherichia coli]MWN48768.1 hypothetical protein [Escherichia coli]MWN62927.1 hypothetical protein [Escherichia coli]